jgi:hypothetical protein
MSEREKDALEQIVTDMSEKIYLGTLSRLRKTNMKEQGIK